MEQITTLTRGGIYLAKLNPIKAAEIGKVRPVIILTAQTILDINPPLVFVCPLSSQSKPEFEYLHIHLPARDNLKVTSFALIEHCWAIATQRIHWPRLGQLQEIELANILEKLKQLLDCV